MDVVNFFPFCFAIKFKDIQVMIPDPPRNLDKENSVRMKISE